MLSSTAQRLPRWLLLLSGLIGIYQPKVTFPGHPKQNYLHFLIALALSFLPQYIQ